MAAPGSSRIRDALRCFDVAFQAEIELSFLRKINPTATRAAREIRLNKGTEGAVKRIQSNEEKQPNPKATHETFSWRPRPRSQFLHEEHERNGRGRC